MALFARVTTTKGDPGRIDEGIDNFKEHVLPAAAQAPGFAGARLHVERETGLAAAITQWESLGALNAAEQLGQRWREQSVQVLQAEVLDVDRFEILISDAPVELVVPTYTRLIQIYAQLEKLEAFIDFTKTHAHPRVRDYEGFRSLVLAVNRMTGRCHVSIGFASREARDASEEAGAATKAEAAQIAGSPEPTVSRREVVVATNARAVSPA